MKTFVKVWIAIQGLLAIAIGLLIAWTGFTGPVSVWSIGYGALGVLLAIIGLAMIATAPRVEL